MPDGTTTIVAVLVAGVAGPGITAWATTRGQVRRFEHERDLHDRDDLRDRLDDVAEALDSFGRVASTAFSLLGQDGPTSVRVVDEVQQGWAEARKTTRLIARLALRIESAAAVLEAARASSEAYKGVLDIVSLAVTSTEFTTGEQHRDLEELLASGRAGEDRFLSAGPGVLHAAK